MKKYICQGLLVVACSLTSHLPGTDLLLEATVAYYQPTGRDFRTIYSGAGIYGLELSVQAWRGLYAWTNANIYTHSGHTSEGNSHLTFVPIGVGLKYLWKVSFVDF